MTRVLRKGSKGPDVIRWQNYLIGSGHRLKADGDFGAKTERATRRWQRSQDLRGDGAVGNLSLCAALLTGFDLVADLEPAPAKLKPYVGNAARATRFGRFEYVAAPTSGNPERIKILHGWAAKNIERVRVDGIPGDKGVRLHKSAAGAFSDLWQAWRRAGLLDHIVSWNGSYVPRFIRGSDKTLSNHAWGTAFDLNLAYNRLGHVPAELDEHGSVRELVPLAAEHGFYWGGHFKRRDGMHFELGRVTR